MSLWRKVDTMRVKVGVDFPAEGVLDKQVHGSVGLD